MLPKVQFYYKIILLMKYGITQNKNPEQTITVLENKITQIQNT